MIYLDNAATSWPKPPAVLRAMCAAMEEAGGNPGRSGHRLAMRAAEILCECRENLARLLGAPDPLRICFTSNATESLNLALKGVLKAGDHVMFSSMEHNSVWRPLRRLEQRGVRLSMARAGAEGVVSPDSVAREIGPDTRLIVLTHASNVNGALNPVAEVGRLARERGILFLVDAAQTAGSVPIDVEAMHIDLLAFSGHKGLLGPQGTGGLYVRAPITLEPLKEGGTGSDSESAHQPEYAPDRYESGTLNTPGIAGLNEGVKYVLDRGVDAIRRLDRDLTAYAMARLAEIPNLRLYGPRDANQKTGVISFNIGGLDPEVAAGRLDGEFAIASRAGLHCAYLAHQSQGTHRCGAVRLSLGAFSSQQDIDAASDAIRILAGRSES